MESDHLRIAASVPLIQESVVDFWESIPRDWPKHKYDVALVEDLDILFREYSQKQGFPIRRVLDCGCGTGNPSIGLAKKGYGVFCVDADPNMVVRFRDNCGEASVEIPVITCDWRDLNGEVAKRGPFDAAICRGNSLIYAGCWERRTFLPEVAARAIATALQHIASVIRPGGLLYVDVTSAKEYTDSQPKFEFVGVRETDAHKIIIYWVNAYFPETRTRHVHCRRLFENKTTHQPEFIGSYTFTGYMLYHDELLVLAERSGLLARSEFRKPASEWLYDVFVFSRS